MTTSLHLYFTCVCTDVQETVGREGDKVGGVSQGGLRENDRVGRSVLRHEASH